jgi:hypothetical protein
VTRRFVAVLVVAALAAPSVSIGAATPDPAGVRNIAAVSDLGTVRFATPSVESVSVEGGSPFLTDVVELRQGQ